MSVYKYFYNFLKKLPQALLKCTKIDRKYSEITHIRMREV